MGEEFNWDDFDAQSNEYLNSDAYQGSSFETGDGQTWGGQGANIQNWTGYDNTQTQNIPSWGSDFNSENLSNTPMPGWSKNGTDWGQVDNQLGTNYNSFGQKAYDAMQSIPNLLSGGQGQGGSQNFLSQLFSGQNGKGLVSILGALAEGRQNKQASSQNPQIIQQMRQQASPFDQSSAGASQMGASSMRDAMQQKLAAAMTDPYGQPLVKAQTDALAQAQAIKDAQAGRRSNNATSSPALIAEQAKIAQNYINSLQNPAGAGMSAGMGGLDQLLAASKAGINGYTSPMMSALGYNTGTATNSAQMNAANGLSTEQKTALIQALLGGK